MKKFWSNLKANLSKINKKIPVSISELNYQEHELFKYIIGGVVLFLLLKGYYVSAGSFALVYVFRFFHTKGQKTWHYLFAVIGFIAIAYQAHTWWPMGLGAILFVHNHEQKTTKEVFWFEMGAGIPYLFLI